MPDATLHQSSGSLTLVSWVCADGKSVLVNFARKVVLSHFNFREPVRCIKFSPDGSKFAAVCGRKVQIWATPAKHKEFTPFRFVLAPPLPLSRS